MVWTRRLPPPEARTDPETLYVLLPPRSPWVWVLSVVALGLAGFVALVIRDAVRAHRATRSSDDQPAATFPLSCEAGQEVRIEGRTFEGSGTLISARDRCKVTITGSRLTGDVVAVLHGSATLLVSDSVLQGNAAAVRLSDRASVVARDRSVLRGDAAVDGDGEVSVVLEDSAAEGRVTGLRFSSGAQVEARRAKISGKAHGIQAFANLRLTGDELTLEGERGLSSASGLRARLKASAVRGKAAGFETGAISQIELSGASRLEAEGTALKGDSQLQVTLDHAEIAGGERGIEAHMHAALRLREGARVEGRRAAVAADADLLLHLSAAKVESAGIAVCATVLAEVRADAASTIAGSEALRFQETPRVLAIDGATVTGSQTFDGEPCIQRAYTGLDERGVLPKIEKERPRAKNGPGPAFDFEAATAALDAATGEANRICHRTRPNGVLAIVDPGFTPDGRNLGAKVRNIDEIGDAAQCVLHYFRKIRVPPYDPTEKPGVMFRIVSLK